MKNDQGTKGKLDSNRQTLKIILAVKKQLDKSHMEGSATHLLGSVQNPASFPCSVAEKKKSRVGAAG